MLIRKKSGLTGLEHTLDVPVTDEQLAAWQGGALIQNAMPNLTMVEREFLLSGMSPEEQARFFGAPGDDE